MSTYNYDKYAIPNKWIADNFERFADMCEQCKKARREKQPEDCQQFEAKKGN